VNEENRADIRVREVFWSHFETDSDDEVVHRP